MWFSSPSSHSSLDAESFVAAGNSGHSGETRRSSPEGHWETVDLNLRTVCLAPDVLIWPVRSQGKRVYRLEIPALHRFYEIGPSEYVFLSLLDGRVTLAQACGLAAAATGHEAVTTDQAEALVRWLLDEQLAYLPENETPVRDLNASVESSHRKLSSPNQPRLLQRLNPFWIKIPLLKASGRGASMLQGLGKSFGWAFNVVPLIIGCLVVLIGVTALWIHGFETLQPERTLLRRDNWIWLLVTWIVLKLIHESAHAAACHHVGGRTKELGIVWILFAPMAYVDVSSCWGISSRRKRMLVSAAGVYVEWVVAAIALLISLQTSSTHWQWLCNNIVLMAGVSTFLFNANALMRFDGYYLLSDWVQIPNLYAQSQGELKRLVLRYVFRLPVAASGFSGWRGWFCRVYGLAALLWKAVVCTTLLIAASTLFAGAGIVFAVFGVLLWFGHPCLRFLRFANEQWRFNRTSFLLGTGVCTFALLVLSAATFWLPIPTSIRFHGVVNYASESLVRSGADGFITAIHARDGQLVRAGDLLIEIENRPLMVELNQLEIALVRNERLQRSAADRHDPGVQKVLRAEAISLGKQLAELRNKSASLRILAPRDGALIAHRLNSRHGTYVREGDELCAVVGRDAPREISALVHQDDIQWVREQLGQPVAVTDPGNTLHLGRLTRIEPRATHRLIEPALAATESGPLSVENDDARGDGEPLRLTDAHFATRVTLVSIAGNKHQSRFGLASGMRAVVQAGHRRDSLGRRLHMAIERLWYKTVKIGRN